MKILEISKKLNKMFNISQIPIDMPFGKLLPIAYKEKKIQIEKYFEKDFLNNFHGLMIKNSEEINEVYLTVFLSEEILDKIIKKDIKNALIFSHHPLDMETSGRGFLSLSEKYLKKLKKNHISVYVIHTPLDINDEISTSGSIANCLNIKKQERYAIDSIGFAGIIGELEEEISFENFLSKLSILFSVSNINYIKKKKMVKKIGIIAGGGSEYELIKETIDHGCDTYLTGDYINKIDNEFGKQQRGRVEKMIPSLDINLIECSHYATEKIVLQNEILAFFMKCNIKCEFIEQYNPWK